MDFPKQSVEVDIASCVASHNKNNRGCRKAIDGIKTQKNNGWAYEPKNANLKLFLKSITYISRVEIKTCLAKINCRIKKFLLRIYIDGKWKIPTNIKILPEEPLTEPVATVDADGNIKMIKIMNDISITFDPIDAAEVLLNVYETEGKNGNVNEIILFHTSKIFIFYS